MDKLAYHYNKKKVPGKTQGTFLYYYPCDPKDAPNLYMGGKAYAVIEVTEREWQALRELDRLEYNNTHKYLRHTPPFVTASTRTPSHPNSKRSGWTNKRPFQRQPMLA